MRETLALEMPISAAMCCWGAALTAQVFDGVGCGKRDLVGATLLVVPVPAAHVVSVVPVIGHLKEDHRIGPWESCEP
jgi:hypothetical protein